MLVMKKIEPVMTYDLRHSILRPHQPIEACMYETDYQEGAFHVGAFYEMKLISIASFCAILNENFSSRKQYRLRAMATLEEYRKLGAGREVVNFAENILKDKGTELLWCMGRTNVQGYYEKLGFRPYGEVFDYPPIGPHIVMVKKLI
ncbi:GNAT family N-acetyltransferase [Fredinandcohnia sp. QZ13]|uniref:GNAT family N-acetyltransferase n=1 Tax=Fredinandcohnia sp. QZ13 TaxID=3073144 RepID=UPI0028530B55|nr:GNAT family N-acetyltransferase [Fredinandcohnia sp. QZ13]MDR4886136.1 GNAT family N-acetyltransferase [Fredinandcohnia sp. QZ13]